ncbi:glycosyltransferase [Candidatus Pacearchaeota archaeon]|nr:glycosyltransferase [Candidatus Pacearchaeota archaeon]
MISIIITAYKEDKTIGKAIESILENKIPTNYEILVLAPDKQTIEVAEKFSKKYKKIKVIKDGGEGKPSALNLAFKIAKGEILILTDGDVYISKDSLSKLLEPFKNKKIGAVSGRPISLNSRKNKFGFWSHLLTDIADKRRKKAKELNRKFYCSGYLFAMKSRIVDKIPKETLSDDGLISFLIHSKGYDIDYSSEAKVYVKFPTNLKDWINQKRRSAGGYNQIKQWTKKKMRSFSKESSGIFQVLEYPKTLQEVFWTLELILFRLYLWMIIFKDINLKKKDFKEIWVRIDSTK